MTYFNKLVNFWFVITAFMIITSASIFISWQDHVRISVILINVLNMILFFLVLKYTLVELSDAQLKSSRLIALISTFSVIFLIAFKTLYFVETNSFFEFSARDSLEYHMIAMGIVEDSNLIRALINSINYDYQLDDLGAVFATVVAYIFYPSPIMFNVLNILAGLITANSVFRLSMYYMNRRHAFTCSLAFGISSFYVYFHSTGMKEVIFTMLVVLAFEKLLGYLMDGKGRNLVHALFYGGSIFFFRPVVMIMMLISLVLGILLSRGKNVAAYLLLASLLILIGIMGNDLYSIGSSISISKVVVAEKQNLTPNLFNYLSAFLASIIGPLPSYVPIEGREQQAFYSLGLGLRMLLAAYSILGVFAILKKRDIFLIAIVCFTIIEMFALALILESFELRYSMPHLPFVYFIAFYYFFEVHEKPYASKHRLIHLLNGGVVFSLIIAWNMRF